MLRNFLSTLKHYKLASSLNIIGLSVAFAAFVIIAIDVNHELSFDRCHSKADRIYKVELEYGGRVHSWGNGQTVVSRGFAEAFGQSDPRIEDYAIYEMAWGASYVTVERDGKRTGFRQDITQTYPSIVDVFDFDMIQGDKRALEDPDKVLIPRSLAIKFFGTEQAVDKVLEFSRYGQKITVGGVFADFPLNTQLDNNIYRQIDKFNGCDTTGTPTWSQNNYFMYVTMAPGASTADVIGKYEAERNERSQESNVVMTPITEIYYANRHYVVDYLLKHGDRATTNIMIAIALLILVIASINFVNFSTSLAPIRIKSINMQKILGSFNGTLRWRLIGEAVGMCVLSFGLALFIIYGLVSMNLVDWTMTGVPLGQNWPIVSLGFGVALVVGFLAGIYPAFYTTRYPPLMVISRTFALSPRGRALRMGLVGFQFVVSIALIIASIFIQVQNNFMRSMDTGLDRSQIAVMDLGGCTVDRDKLDNELMKNPKISDVAYSQFSVGGSNMAQGWGRDFKGKTITFDAIICSWNFPQVMGIEVIDGEGFRREDKQREGNLFMFNEAASKAYGLKMGDDIDRSGDMVGIMADFNFKSLHFAIGPMALVMREDASYVQVAYVKIDGDPYAVADYIRTTVASLDPAFPLKLEFYDQTFNNLYQKERKMGDMITTFSMVAIIISLVGVFGLVLFETQYRRKEIGLRKINGATVAIILNMFTMRFVWIVLACFVLSAPLAWWGVSSWLQGFAYCTPMHWWVFALALLIVMLVTVLTVVVQTYRAATENPVKSILS